MSMQLQSTSTVLAVSEEETEPLSSIKNEPLESEIGIDDIPNSLDEEIPDMKEIDIVSYELSEDLIKSETISENTFENNYSGSVETRVFVKTENIPLIKIENLTQSEYLHKTQDTRDGNINRGTRQGVIEVQGSNEHFNTLQSDKQFVNFFKDLSDISRKAKCPNKTDFSECYKTVETTLCEKDKKKRKVIEVPVIPIEPHKYTSLAKESTHKQNKKRYYCEKCTFISENHSYFKRHKLSHKTKAEVDGRYLKYRCDKCKYKTCWSTHFKVHKLRHLKPEEIQYFYCYHCSYKSNQKSNLRTHIFSHFKRGEIPFNCYICDFVTLKRNLIIKHFKKHPKHHSKCDERDYKNQIKIPYFYCYHCSYKCERKYTLKTHIFRHFKNEDILFRCYICDFVTLNRNLIIEHFKTHPKHHSKYDETNYINQLETYTKYRCDKCKYETCLQTNFKAHKLIHLKPEEIQYFYCYHCSIKTKRKGDLKAHLFRHFKNEDVPFHCYICDFTTLKRNLIIEHFKKHPKHHSKCDEADYKNQLDTYTRKRTRYCCEKCTYTSGKSYDLKHQLIHKTEAEIDDRLLKYRYDKCKYKTFMCSSFKEHKLIPLKPEEIQYFYCYHCPYKCNRKSNLKIHIFNHFKKEEVLFHCYICDFTTIKRNLIIEHFKKHPKHHSKYDETDYKNHLEAYTKNEMRYCCEKCAYTSGKSSNFKLHQLTHKTKAEIDDRLLKYRCDNCKYKTYKFDRLKDHKLTHLKPEEIQYFYCYHCSFKSKRKGDIKRHIFNHFKKGEVPFHCYICDFTTLKRNRIIEHFKKHPKHHSKCEETDYKNHLETYTKKEMRYCCEKCTYTSGNSSNFKRHQLTHKTKAEIDDQLLKYHCNKCKYKTYVCSNLKKHKLTHLKPEEIQYFYCYHCPYKSKRKSHLKIHILNHFKKEEVPFHCYICDFVTLKRESFKNHLKDHNKCDETEYRNQLLRFYKIL